LSRLVVRREKHAALHRRCSLGQFRHPIRLGIAGQDPLRAACERRAATLGLGERVRSLGRVTCECPLRDIFATSDAFLFMPCGTAPPPYCSRLWRSGSATGCRHVDAGARRDQGLVTSPSATTKGLVDGIRAMAAAPVFKQWLGKARRSARHRGSRAWVRLYRSAWTCAPRTSRHPWEPRSLNPLHDEPTSGSAQVLLSTRATRSPWSSGRAAQAFYSPVPPA
jgi:hypothetical protein